jgi:hypothetical protein
MVIIMLTNVPWLLDTLRDIWECEQYFVDVTVLQKYVVLFCNVFLYSP